MRSMTGYGQASWSGGGRRLSVEVRSVNHRFLDVKMNLPREYAKWEEELRQVVQAAVERGRVEVAVTRSGVGAGDFEVEVNEALARAAVEGWRQLQKRLELNGQVDVGMIARSEFVRVVERRGDGADEIPRVKKLLRRALTEFNRVRDREGKVLAADMKLRRDGLRKIHEGLEARTVVLVPELQRRLAARMAELLGDRTLGEERLAQEAALLADRCDVTEELVRLGAHLDRLGELIRQKGPAGKAIDFLVQEIHREVNTIASKSADLEVTNLALAAKAEVEKLREQVQNVE